MSAFERTLKQHLVSCRICHRALLQAVEIDAVAAGDLVARQLA